MPIKVRSLGYTLVELLVVISILAVLGVFAIANFKNFAQDQIINKTMGQMQSALRLAQSNATSGAFCLVNCPNPNLACGDWWAEFRASGNEVKLYCARSIPDTSVQKSFSLEGVTISKIEGNSTTCPGPFNSATVKITYSAIYGLLTFGGSEACFASSSLIKISILNQKTNNTKSFNLSKGGAIDVQ